MARLRIGEHVIVERVACPHAVIEDCAYNRQDWRHAYYVRYTKTDCVSHVLSSQLRRWDAVDRLAKVLDG